VWASRAQRFVATGPATPSLAVVAASLQEPRVVVAPAPVAEPPAPARLDVPAPVARPCRGVDSARERERPEPEPQLAATAAAPEEESAPLCAEVASVDRARGPARAGQACANLGHAPKLRAAIPAARLLPEVLFLRLEAGGAWVEPWRRARGERLVDVSRQSPHASSARKLLGP